MSRSAQSCITSTSTDVPGRSQRAALSASRTSHPGPRRRQRAERRLPAARRSSFSGQSVPAARRRWTRPPLSATKASSRLPPL
jgi:hypothetical protein